MKRTNPNSAVYLIILWSLAVHVPGLLSPLRDYHAYRQCQTSSVARNYARHGMHFLNPEVDTNGPPVRAATEFPVYSYLLAGPYEFFGVHEIFGRLLSILFAAWGAVFLYYFVKRRLGQRIALWSALVMCSIPVHIYFTRSVQPEPMALWGLLGFLYYADLWLYVRREMTVWLAMVLLGALAPLLKMPYLYILAPLWLYLGHEHSKKIIYGSYGWMLAFFCILFSTMAWYAYAKTAPVQVLPLNSEYFLQNLAPIASSKLWVDQFISRIPELVLTYSGLVFALAGLYYYRKAKAFPFFAAWLAISFLYVPLLGEYGHIHRYTLLPLAPAAAVWIACGISTLWEHGARHPILKALVIILIIGMPVHAAFRIKHWYKLDYGYLDRAHATLQRVSKPEDLVLVSSHEMPELLYYLDHYGYAIEPSTWTPEEASTQLHRGVKFIFIPLEDNQKIMPQWTSYLKTRGKLVEQDKDYFLYKIG